MGLFEKFRKLFQKEEPSDLFLKGSEPKPLEQDDLRRYEFGTPRPEPTLERHGPAHKIEVVDTNQAIEAWEKTLSAAQQHPLSQVKILNTQVLEDLSNVLKSMDSKLDKLDKLDRLDEIYNILMHSKAELEAKGVRSEHLDAALAEVERLTIKDKDVIDWLAKQERVTAQQLADRIGLSRSTASFRLNRLAELGVLDKEAVGKKIFYRVKNLPKKEELYEPSVQTEPSEF
jgi:DNA-binding transcriptional ArsR family regulator